MVKNICMAGWAKPAEKVWIAWNESRHDVIVHLQVWKWTSTVGVLRLKTTHLKAFYALICMLSWRLLHKVFGRWQKWRRCVRKPQRWSFTNGHISGPHLNTRPTKTAISLGHVALGMLSWANLISWCRQCVNHLSTLRNGSLTREVHRWYFCGYDSVCAAVCDYLNCVLTIVHKLWCALVT